MGTIAAVATAPGGALAVIRVAGADPWGVAVRAGLAVAPGAHDVRWHPAGRPGGLPLRQRAWRGPRTATGTDVVELDVPGSPDVVELVLGALFAAGAEPAAPGAFTRLALANGRLDLDQALAVLALVTAPSAAAAAAALSRLHGALAADLAPVRDRLLVLRAVVEAGLDFLDEADVRAFDPGTLQRECRALAERLARWQVAAADVETVPSVVLVGPANAGKSALFAACTGSPALVSPVAGTTRDTLEGVWNLGGRTVRLIDTAGWLDGVGHGDLDAAAVARGRAAIAGAAVILACSAPDARLPEDHGLPEATTVVVATKADLGHPDPRAAVAVRVTTLDQAPSEALAGLVASRLAAVPAAEPRQQRLLATAQAVLRRLAERLPGDELLAEDLRTAADALADLLGASTPDDVLDTIFSRFCIGK